VKAEQRALAQRTPAPRRAATRQPAARSYRVRNGDNLTRIAKRHGVSITALRSANGIRGDRIRAGSTLRIPAR
jgi:membrane-bound lytic murein transglycosylase D